MSAAPISDDDLHAYADRQLAPEREAAFEAALAADPVAAARVAEIRAQSGLLRDAFDPMLALPIPDRLLAAASPPASARAAARKWIAPAFAAAATLVVGVGLGWFGRDLLLERAGTPTTFVKETALVHALYAADAKRPVEVWASEEKSLVNWLTKRLGFQVHAPDLNSLGFSLVGGRLVAGNENPTALFMYENADKQRLTLQVRKRPVIGGESAFRYAVDNGVGVYYWIENNCSYALSGNLDKAQILSIGRVVYGQLAALDAAVPK